MKRVFLLIAAFVSLAASPFGDYDELRLGNEALKRKQYERALTHFQQAQAATLDPGLAAFNQATAYTHLGNFRQAEIHYRLVLGDDAISAKRRAKALYNLANSLARQAGPNDVKMLRESIRIYERAIHETGDKSLKQQARFNLEVVKLLWNRARASLQDPPPPNADAPPDREQPSPIKQESGGTNTSPKDKKSLKDAKMPKDSKIDGKEPGHEEARKSGPAEQPDASRVPVIPDTDEVVRQPAEDTLKALRLSEERLRNERRQHRRDLAIPEIPSGRDW